MNVFVLKIVQIIAAVLLTLLVLIQSKGGGFSAGIAKSFSFYRSRRGLEKTVFYITIFISILVVVNSVLIILFS